MDLHRRMVAAMARRRAAGSVGVVADGEVELGEATAAVEEVATEEAEEVAEAVSLLRSPVCRWSCALDRGFSWGMLFGCWSLRRTLRAGLCMHDRSMHSKI